MNGAVNVSGAITEELGIGGEGGETTEDGLITLERVACLGCCSLAPVIMVNDKVFGKLTPEKARKLMRELREGGKLDV